MVEPDTHSLYSYIAMELCDFTVKEWLKQTHVQEEKDWSKKAVHLVEGLLSGLKYMHTSGPYSILHVDLKVGLCFII